MRMVVVVVSLMILPGPGHQTSSGSLISFAWATMNKVVRRVPDERTRARDHYLDYLQSV